MTSGLHTACWLLRELKGTLGLPPNLNKTHVSSRFDHFGGRHASRVPKCSAGRAMGSSTSAFRDAGTIGHLVHSGVAQAHSFRLGRKLCGLTVEADVPHTNSTKDIPNLHAAKARILKSRRIKEHMPRSRTRRGNRLSGCSAALRAAPCPGMLQGEPNSGRDG